MDVFEVLIVVFFGLTIGSFIGAYSYREPLGKSISKGRSKCPKCGHAIAWYDNIPILSYLALGGKCRYCGKHISRRYPIIEASTAFAFLAVGLKYKFVLINLLWLQMLGVLGLPLVLLFVAIMVAVFVIDFEHQIIPDELVFFGMALLITVFLVFDIGVALEYLLAGIGSSMFLLGLHLVTRGKGMGLGDVKLAIFVGTFLGFPLAVGWLFTSFVLGAVIGIILILAGNKSLKTKIAFGPFLVLSFFVMLFWGNTITSYIIPVY